MLKIFQAETGKDLGMIKMLFAEYVDSLEFNLDFQDFEEELVNLPSGYAPPSGCLLLAKYKDQLAGCVALRQIREEVCEMKRLYVRPEFRCLGIGRALAQAIIEQARRIGYIYMRLDTVPAMEIARTLYKSLDFKQISPYRHNPIKGAVFMELKLV